nr:hypothetical protein asmbl_7 [uncultured bacterium]
MSAPVVLLEADGLAGALTEDVRAVVLPVVVAGHGVDGGARLLGRLDRDVPVAADAGTGRDQLPDDHVLLEAEQAVALALDRGVGEHLGRLLEGRGRQPRLRRQRRLGDPHQHRAGRGRLAALGDDPTVLGLEQRPLDQRTGQELRRARVDDGHPLQHLADDHLDVLVVDRHALAAVDLLDLADQVQLHLARAHDPQHLVRVDRTLGELLPDLDVTAVLDPQPRATRQLVVDDLVGAVVRGDRELPELLAVLDPDGAGQLGDRGLALGDAGLEELHHTRQAVGDVLTRDTTGVEGAHRQLGAGLTDRLGGDDADRLADVHQLAGRERPAVAGGAGAQQRLAGEHAAHLDLGDTGVDQLADEDVTQVRAGLRDQRAVRGDHVGGQRTGVHAGLDVRVTGDDAIVHGADRHDHAALGAAVLLADDDVLRDVDQPAGEVPGVRGPQRGVREALAGTVRGDEVLQHGQTLPEVGLDRPRDDLALRVGHQTTHAGDLADLHHVASGARVDHDPDRVGGREVVDHRLADLGPGTGPDLDELGPTLGVGDDAALVLALDLAGLVLVPVQDLLLDRRGDDVVDGNRDARAGRPAEAGRLEGVQRRRHLDLRVALGEVVDDRAQRLLRHLVVDEPVVLGKGLVEEHPAEAGGDDGRLAGLPALGGLPRLVRAVVDAEHLVEADERPLLQRQCPLVEGHDRLGRGAVGLRQLALGQLRRPGQGGQVVQAQHHVLGRRGDRTTVGRAQDVVAGQHQDAGLGLGLGRQRQVHRHLVAVEVRVEGGADQRVDLDGLALDQLRLEGLDAQPVQGRRAVQQHRVLGDDLLEHVPHHRPRALHHPLGGLDVLRVVEVHQPLHDEGLEQLQRHLLGQAALVQLQLRADDDDRTAGVVDALAEQVLPEPALLALEEVRQRLQRAVARAGDRPAATAVVEQRVHGLLEHPLLVVDDDLRSAQVEQPLEPVVPVDHAPVQVVHVAGGEAATVELHHRAQVRRDDRDAVQHHAHGRVLGLLERRDDLQPLERPQLPLALAAADRLAQRDGLGVQVEVGEQLLQRRGAHAALEVLTEAVAQLAVEPLVGDELLDLQLAEGVEHLLEAVDLPLGAVTQLAHLALAALTHLAAHVGLGTLGLELGQVGLQLLLAGLDVGVATGLQVVLLRADLRLDGREVPVAGLVVDRGDQVGGEVDDLLEVLGRQVEQVAQARGDALEEPDVGDRRGQLDVAHPLTTHLGAGHLDAAALTDDALEPDALVLAAVALPVPGGTEDLLAEQTVLLRAEGAVVDGLGLLHLTVRPLTDVVAAGQADAELVEEVDVEH